MYMSTFLRLFLGLIALVSLSVRADEPVSQYQLSSGDVISISVYAEPDLSFESIRLNDAGTFTFPFIGEVRARGKTPTEVEQYLVQQLKGDFLVDPRVSINVLQYRDFYISGEVKKPGGYPYQPNLTIRRAIALGGGLSDRASERRIFVVRDLDPERKPTRAELDSIVQPGDTVTVEQGFF